ncbi:MAG TPA: prephenate dehydratase [Gemmataceae bacterium]|nr:prephenate dehydratase [Gemmataceae bacterium]
MTRKNETGSSAVSNRAAGSLRQLRSQIDKLDLQILKVVNERARLAAEIGRLKTDQGSEVFNPAREEEVYQHVLEANKGPLDAATIRGVFREIMSGARALQRVLKVSYLGPEYSFSHLAAVERFGSDIEFIRVGSIAAVFEEVNRGHTDFGVVPLENSTDGRVADTLDMFMRLPQMKICAEVRLRIHHNLLANCEQSDIRRVYSKPQALSQCRNWLSKNVPHASLHEVASTAVAAELAQREPGAAAVASRQAAVRYSLRILFSDIEDSPDNETRFAVIGTQESPRTGHDKTGVMFRIAHTPGSLVQTLDVFRQNKLNMTWIESFPARSAKSEYVFFVDFEGHIEDPKVKRALAALEQHCEEIHVLGSYPVATVSG